MNKREKEFLDKLIISMELKRDTHCQYCHEIIFELKLLQAKKIGLKDLRNIWTG